MNSRAQDGVGEQLLAEITAARNRLAILEQERDRLGDVVINVLHPNGHEIGTGGIDEDILGPYTLESAPFIMDLAETGIAFRARAGLHQHGAPVAGGGRGQQILPIILRGGHLPDFAVIGSAVGVGDHAEVVHRLLLDAVAGGGKGQDIAAAVLQRDVEDRHLGPGGHGHRRNGRLVRSPPAQRHLYCVVAVDGGAVLPGNRELVVGGGGADVGQPVTGGQLQRGGSTQRAVPSDGI